jgi:ribose 5-phosphate isomerase B
MPGGAIAVASDHAGFDLKEILKRDLEEAGHEVLDLGTHSTASVDYPDFGKAVGDAIASGKAERGVLVCGSGIGIAMAANRNAKVRAVVAHDVTSARLSREHNDANVIAFGQRLTGVEVARDALKTFLATEFAGGRHIGRVEKLSKG